ncbi:MAG: hypothetical protein Fues2KO_33940 [Fuerstiella sp.]
MSVTIHCPKCNSGLKLPDRSLLGRKGKCPKCQHRFVLEEPDEVQLELAEPPAPSQTPAAPDAPLLGTSAKWVPDEPNGNPPPTNAAESVPAVPPATQQVPAATDFQFSEAPAAPANPFDFSDPKPAAESSPATTDTSAPAATSDNASSILQRRRRKKNRTGPIIVGVGTALLVFCLLGFWWQQSSAARQQEQDELARAEPKANEAWEADRQQLADSNTAAARLSPTSGEPIPIQFMPFTPHLLCHLRPAEIWASNRNQQEFVATLGQLGVWLAERISTITRFQPGEIEELTFAINFGARTSEPDVAAVVRLKEDQSAADLQLNRFKGRVRPDLPVKIYEAEDFSYMLVDPRTVVVASAELSGELAEAKNFSRAPSVDLELLLQESDRQRHVSLLFDAMNIDTHREYVFGEETQQIADQFVVWLGKDIQTVSWSLHLTPDRLFMETLLKNSNESSPLRVKRHMEGRFAKLPDQLLAAARMMKPATTGYRDMIGRFPAMMKATVLGTSSHVGQDYVRLVTLLPPKAAPNLAAASLFTWNQSLVTDFDGPAQEVAGTSQQLPDNIVERLKQVKVLVDFGGTPLGEVMEYLAEEIQLPIEVDGDGLMKVALTQNMRQNLKLGEVPAIQLLDAIVNNPDYRGMMVMVIDEQARRIIITSKPAAEAAGLTVFDPKQ